MFEIEYKGANSVIISTKKAKLVVDPKLSIVGLKDLSTKGAVELVTESRFAVKNPETSLLIDGPGEYGVADFHIRGVAVRRNLDSESEGLVSTMYRVEIGEARIGIIGNIYEKPTDEQFEELGLLDIVIIPVGGGGYTLDAVGAASVVRMIGPKIVIPIHHSDKSLKYEVPQDDLKLFVAELGASVEVMAKYKSKQPSIAPAPLSVIELTRS